ncbi:MAG: bacteriocin family protein [Candidatus Brocadiales bacterium]|nr:bacteriocin family protein [Candidatus Brocadiales bacterium]
MSKKILNVVKEATIGSVIIVCCLMLVVGMGNYAFGDQVQTSAGKPDASKLIIGTGNYNIDGAKVCRGENARSGKIVQVGGSFFIEEPLGHNQLEQMKRVVTNTSRKQLVGRKFIKAYGSLGAGAQSVPWDTYLPPAMGNLDLLGESEQQPVGTQKRAFLPLPQIYKDFILYNRDIAAAGNEEDEDDGGICLPLDLSTLVNAVTQCAKKEDNIIFNGIPEMGVPGLTNVEGRNIIPMKDWSVLGDGFLNVVEATQKLAETGFYGPYALVVSPHLYLQLHRVFEKTGVLEIQRVKSFIKCGVYSSNALKGDKAVVIATGTNNMDLVIGQDMGLAYYGPENLNHRFRVWESAVLRIKCAQAICTIE